MKIYRIKPGSRLNLGKIDPSDTGDYTSNEAGKAKAEADTRSLLDRLKPLQERLYANAGRSLLIVLQAMDTGGKDGTIKHVMAGINPQGCRVTPFKAPSARELAHDFLWRVHQEAPPKGYIGIFNRSHYEDVLITRVHGRVSDDLAEQRFKQIRDFERLLHENGTDILKFFLHISKDEQRERLEARVRNPDKRWKFNPGDLEERKLWSNYMAAYEDAISATSTEHAPWHVIPANRKWYRNLAVAQTVVDALEDMHLKRPPDPDGVDFEKLKIV
ncbi:MAG: polyphosphate kinase 2 family protein [Nitrospiraceae bacterium]